MKSPIAWPGGKTKLAPKIVKYKIVKYLHETPHKIYVEPFMGSCAVLFAKSPHVSTSEVVNDAHNQLVNLFIVLRDKRKEFIGSFRYTLHAETYADYLMSLRVEDLGGVEQARRFFYLTKAAFGQRFGENAVIRQEEGKQVQMGRLDISKIKRIAERLEERLENVVITCRDYQRMSDFDGADTLYYIDPPYFGTTQKGYGGSISSREFVPWVRSLKGKVIISHEMHKGFDRAFSSWNRTEIGYRVTSLSRSSKGRRRVMEYLYSNYELPTRKGMFDEMSSM